MKLIHTLERMGECQVSMGDPDLAREHFVQALQLLEEQRQQQTRRQHAEEGPSSSSSSSIGFLDTHSSLCLYIGQLSLEREALEAYLRGIASLEQCIQQVEGGGGDGGIDIERNRPQQVQQDQSQQQQTPPVGGVPQLQELKQKLSQAYCNVAELYLTDLCEEETAENDCQEFLERALQIPDVDGEPLVDALQTMASLRLSQQPDKQLEAVPFILRAYEKQRVGSEALAALVGLNHDDDGGGGDDDDGNGEGTMEADKDQARELLHLEAANNLPEFEFRCQTAKLLLECAAMLKATRREADGDDVDTSGTASGAQSQEQECVSAAISVLGSLLAQNDEVVEIWYLTGCAFAAKSPPLVDAARFYLDRAKEMLMEIRKSLQQEGQLIGGSDTTEQDDLEEQLDMNSTQLQDVQTKLDELEDDDAPMEE
jgi:tetratricopeptide (TPR) repeat protein